MAKKINFFYSLLLILPKTVSYIFIAIPRRLWFLIKATFGEYDRCDTKAKPESRFVIRAIVGDFTFTTFDNDVALLRLNDRVPMVDIIKPVCLPTVLSKFSMVSSAILSGRGGDRINCIP